MIKDTLQIKGFPSIILHDADGNIKQQIDCTNLVVQTGLNFLATALTTGSYYPFSYMALGTGTTHSNINDVALTSELVRTTFTSTSITQSMVTFVTTFGPGVGTGAITEAGIFNADSAGTMLSHVVFDVVNKAPTDSLTILWTITLS